MIKVEGNEVHIVGTDLEVMSDVTKAMSAVCMGVAKDKEDKEASVGATIYAVISMAAAVLRGAGYKVPIESICESLLEHKGEEAYDAGMEMEDLPFC